MIIRAKMLTVIMILSITTLMGIPALAIAQEQTETYECETCPMLVDAEAQDHFKVYDVNGDRHWVECIGCALKLLKTYDTLHIETYCDWYGPNYPIIIDISDQGAKTTVTPDTALTLMGGGCTGNRMAYNQTAADNLLSNGYSQYTMTMMKQSLPVNTNTTTVQQRALTFVASSTTEAPDQNPMLLVAIAVVGVAVILGGIVAFKKIKK
jgi:hypothetical protein